MQLFGDIKIQKKFYILGQGCPSSCNPKAILKNMSMIKSVNFNRYGREKPPSKKVYTRLDYQRELAEPNM